MLSSTGNNNNNNALILDDMSFKIEAGESLAIVGASGSGILNEDMELIGVLFATHPAYKNSTLTSTYASTLLFLSHAMRKIEVTK